MRNGVKVYDSDTHMRASAETIEPYLTARVRELVPDLDARKVPITRGMGGAPREAPFKHDFQVSEAHASMGWLKAVPRVLGEAEPREGVKRDNTGFRGKRWPTEGGSEDADIRIKDMDEEGVDVQVLVPELLNPTRFSGSEETEVLVEFMAAQHRHLHDFCGAYPHRLRSLLVVTPRDVDASVAEINKWGPEAWSAGLQLKLPLDYPIDHPDIHPILAAAQANDLPLVHHSLNMGYPGYRDLWQNPFLGRTASHPWAAMRFLGAVTASGMMDKFPELRVAILESGFGWLPFWVRRLDEQLVYMGFGAEDLKHPPSYYLLNGRFFASIEMHEGADMMCTVTDYIGDGVLMLGTDYPHAESYFPDSVDFVLAWEKEGITKDQMQKLMWDNAVRCFGEP